jgi:hypothetical protein
MNAQELRAEVRVPVMQRGNLSAGTEWFSCMVMDMSSSGLLIVSTRQLEAGQILEVKCELYPGKVLDCMVEVMHSDEDSAGTMITEIDERATKLLQGYLEEKLAVMLDKKPTARESHE